MKPIPNHTGKLAQLFGIDCRALAVFRMALGLLLLADLAIRATDLSAMYTDQGILSAEACRVYYGPWNWSLYWLSGSWGVAVGLFGLAAVFALTLMLGAYTRVSKIVSWILLCSIQLRMPAVLNGGDIVFRMLLFWGMFLPLGGVWSVDAWRRGSSRPRPSGPVVSIATAAVLTQVFLVYWFTGLAKLNDVWLGFDPLQIGELLADPSQIPLGGPALSYILAQEIYARPLASTLLNYPTLLPWLSLATVALEVLGPWLLFFPWRTGSFRLLIVACFVAMHAGIEATIHVGLFSYVSLAAWILFLPHGFWSCRLFQLFGGASRRGADGAGAADDSPGRPLAVCRFTSSGVCLLLLLLVLFWNITGVLDKNTREAARGDVVSPIATMTMTNQSWNMFGRPEPLDYWYVYRAVLVDGAVVDVFRGGPVEVRKPAYSAAVFPNHRWRKLHRQMVQNDYRVYRGAVARYLIRRWNEGHGPRQQIMRLEMICLKEHLNGPRPRYRRSTFVDISTFLPEFLPPPRVELD